MESNEEEGHAFTPADMSLWLRDEVRWVMKEAELRIKDATDLTTAYLAGKLSPGEAWERKSLYDDRWGETKLIAAMPEESTTNEEIVRRLDVHRAEGWKRFSRGGDSGERGRG
jgi:hypothetical protein